MRLQQVCITNFKGITEKTIELKKDFNLIIGENGTGKTSILEAIAVGLGGFMTGIGDIKTRHFSNNEVRCVYSELGDASYNRRYEQPTEVWCQAVFQKELYPDEISKSEMCYRWKRAKNSLKSSRTTLQPRTIAQVAERLVNADENFILPLLCFQGAGRVWAQKREKNQNPFAASYFRTVGYLDCLTEEANVKMLQNWCFKMEQIAWNKNLKISEYEAVKKAVADFMQYMEQDESDYSVFYDRQYETLMFQTKQILSPITALSAGYQSLIWMVFDIAYRMAVLNPQLKERLVMDTPGIVLIDEIDLHLHPKWQWHVVDALTHVFPNVQFIATTHSPIVIAAARNAWLIDMSGDNAFEKLHGLDVNETLKIIQNSQDLPDELGKKETQFYTLLEKRHYDEAREILEQLESELGENIPLISNMRVTYELETTMLEV